MKSLVKCIVAIAMWALLCNATDYSSSDENEEILRAIAEWQRVAEHNANLREGETKLPHPGLWTISGDNGKQDAALSTLSKGNDNDSQRSNQLKEPTDATFLQKLFLLLKFLSGILTALFSKQ